MMDQAVERIVAAWELAKQDLQVCHEYYCRNNCHTLVAEEGQPWPHTPRCRRLREEYGFASYPREVEIDIKKLLDQSDHKREES